MKKWITIFCLLFSILNSNGQTALNENWDLKVVYYYKNGSYRVADSVFTYSGNDSLDQIGLNTYKNKIEREFDEFVLKSAVECNGDLEKINHDYTWVGVQYFIKPKRKITTKDTFLIHLYEQQSDGFDTLRNVITYNNVTEQYNRDTLFKDFIPLKRINFSNEVTTIGLKYKSSDTTLKNLNNTYTTNTRNRIVGVFMENQKEKLNQFLYLNAKFKKQNLLNYEPVPKQDWLLNYPSEELDTVGIIRNLLKVERQFKIEKSYAVIPKQLVITTKEKMIHFLMSGLQDSCKFKYKLVPWEVYDDKDIPWVDCPLNYDIISVPILEPGEYVLHIKSTYKFWNRITYRITVRPQWFQTLAFKIAFPLVVILFGLVVFIFLNRKRHKKKLEVLSKEKHTLDINLKSVRSQLNPHFIFNALNSIQGLITTTQYEKANEYLLEFSNMLRKPLNAEDVKHWTLNDEIELLKSYIKIEQLRTPFELNFSIDETINKEAINFPILLLQPLIENAIKHALVKAKYPNLNIEFKKHNHDLLISIQDNGEGFELEINKNGNGLKLTKEYINLVNQQFEQSKVNLRIESDDKGTTIQLNLENWIDE